MLNAFISSEYDWSTVVWSDNYKMYLLTKDGKEVSVADQYNIMQCSNTGHLVGKFLKAHWAKGRVVSLVTNVPGISSGEYEIVEKEGYPYGYSDTLHLKRHVPVLDTARKVHNWLEKQAKIQEKVDGITTEKLVREMKVT